MKQFLIYSIIMGCLFYSCSPTTQPTASSTARYSEDLSAHRPKFKADLILRKAPSEQVVEEKSYPDPEFDVTEQLAFVLDSINRIKADRGYIDGYTIQVYSGVNSTQAKAAKGKLYSILDDAQPSLKYDEPNFKVKIGQYYTKLEAQKTYSKIRSHFPKSIIIPARFQIKN